MTGSAEPRYTFPVCQGGGSAEPPSGVVECGISYSGSPLEGAEPPKHLRGPMVGRRAPKGGWKPAGGSALAPRRRPRSHTPLVSPSPRSRAGGSSLDRFRGTTLRLSGIPWGRFRGTTLGTCPKLAGCPTYEREAFPAGEAQVLEVGERLRLGHRTPRALGEQVVGELDDRRLAQLAADAPQLGQPLDVMAFDGVDPAGQRIHHIIDTRTGLPSLPPSEWLDLKYPHPFVLKPGVAKEVAYTMTPPASFNGEAMAMVVFGGPTSAGSGAFTRLSVGINLRNAAASSLSC